MKVCLKCNHLIDSKMKFCYNCGGSDFIEVASDETTDSSVESKPSGQPENQQLNSVGTANETSQKSQNGSSDPISYQTFTQYQSLAESSHLELYPMKWYKFLIYFLLWFSAFSNAVSGFCYISGEIYSLESGGLLSAKKVYHNYESLQFVDIIYGLILIALAGSAIYTRSQLANYKSNGPKCLYFLYGAGASATLFYNILVSAVTGLNIFNTYTIISLITSVVVLILNYIYFSKRDFMFMY